jgi:hypothetical protein
MIKVGQVRLTESIISSYALVLFLIGLTLARNAPVSTINIAWAVFSVLMSTQLRDWCHGSRTTIGHVEND